MKKKGIILGMTLAGVLMLSACGDRTADYDAVKLRTEAERVDWYNEVTTTGEGNQQLRDDLIKENQETTEELTDKVLKNLSKSTPLTRGFLQGSGGEGAGGSEPVFRGRVLSSYMDVERFLKEETSGITERRHLDKDGIYQGLVKFEGVTLAENLSSRGGFERVPGATILSGHEGLNNFLGFDRHGEAQFEIEPNPNTDIQRYVRIIDRRKTKLKDTQKALTYRDVEKVKGKGFGIKHTHNGTPVYADNYRHSVTSAIGRTLQPLSSTLIYDKAGKVEQPVPVMLMEDDWKATQRLYAFLSLTGTDVANQIFGSVKDGKPTGMGLRGIAGTNLELDTKFTADGYIVFRIDKYNGKRDLTNPTEIEKYYRELEMLEEHIKSVEAQQFLVHPEIYGIGYKSKIIINGQEDEVSSDGLNESTSHLTAIVSSIAHGIDQERIGEFKEQLEKDGIDNIKKYIRDTEDGHDIFDTLEENGISDYEYIEYIQIVLLGLEEELEKGKIGDYYIEEIFEEEYQKGRSSLKSRIEDSFKLIGHDNEHIDMLLDEFEQTFEYRYGINTGGNGGGDTKEDTLNRFNINVVEFTGIAPIYGIEG